MSEGVRTHVVVPGTFDPVTFGHLDVIQRTRRLFPRVTVAVAASVGKRGVGTAFTLEERVQMLRSALAAEGLRDVDVQPFTGLLVDFCAQVGASASSTTGGTRKLTSEPNEASSLTMDDET